MKNLVLVSVLCSIVLISADTQVQRCNDHSKSAKQSVNIENCNQPPCILNRRTTYNIEFKFVTDSKIEKLINNVTASIFGVTLPFIGVHGTNACDQIYQSDGVTPTKCPLEANKEYVYKNKLEIKEFYPKLKTEVQWSLTSKDGHDVLCFRVPIAIN